MQILRTFLCSTIASCILIFSIPSHACEILKGKVVGVRDGDTIEILVDKKEVPIRLSGVDAPEKKQAFGQKAKQFTSDKVFGKRVKVVVIHQDSYKRKVGEVFISGVSLNEELIAAGMAWQDPRYSKSLGLAALQERAKAEKRGLWVDPKPVEPWEWRKN